MEVSRWEEKDLPQAYNPAHILKLEGRPDVFDYAPNPEQVDWHLNFAHHDLFCAYGRAPFAQDEIQVAEHPALASLREALLDSELPPSTVEHGGPTPILITQVPRLASIRTDAIYGASFSRASEAQIDSSVEPLRPPTRSNILAMEAPFGARGPYRSMQIDYILNTAFTGFSAAREASVRLPGAPKVVIHTGFWGCGAYGGHRVLMPALQIIAARLAGVQSLVFHAFDPAGLSAFEKARTLVDKLGAQGKLKLSKLRSMILAEGFEWGRPDGN